MMLCGSRTACVSVILSAAKNLNRSEGSEESYLPAEILRCTQDDKDLRSQTERERVAKFLNAGENGTLSYQRSAFSDQLGKDDSYRKAG